jgi:hypothetical protein
MERGVSSSGAAPNGSFDRMESSYFYANLRQNRSVIVK